MGSDDSPNKNLDTEIKPNADNNSVLDDSGIELGILTPENKGKCLKEIEFAEEVPKAPTLDDLETSLVEPAPSTSEEHELGLANEESKASKLDESGIDIETSASEEPVPSTSEPVPFTSKEHENQEIQPSGRASSNFNLNPNEDESASRHKRLKQLLSINSPKSKKFQDVVAILPSGRTDKRNLPLLNISWEKATPITDPWAEHFKQTLAEISTLQCMLPDEKDKTHLKTSGSEWKMDTFLPYVPFLDISYDLDLSESSDTDTTCEKIRKEYKRLGQVFAEPSKDDNFDAVLSDLKQKAYNETTITVFINAFMKHIALENEIKLRLQETLKVTRLPPNVPDYTIYTGDGKILGCIEVKASHGLIRPSVVQTMLQLMSSRERASNTLFSILTDAYRFIFIQYNTDDKFQLETYKLFRSSGAKCKEHTIRTVDDLRKVVGIVDALIKDGKAEIETGIRPQRKEKDQDSAKHVAGSSTGIRPQTKEKRQESAKDVVGCSTNTRPQTKEKRKENAKDVAGSSTAKRKEKKE